MLEGLLYKTLSLSGDPSCAKATVVLLDDSEIYKAHFPGFPVTPGVCIVGMAVELASALTGKKLSLAEAKDIKFVTPIFPKGETKVDFDFSLEDDILKASVSVDGAACAKMTVTVKQDARAA